MNEVGYEDLGGGIGVVVLNRPHKRNAINAAMRAELTRIFGSEDAARNKVVILRAEGTVFSAGKDLRDVGVLEPKEDVEAAIGLFESIHRAPAIVIACVEGPALGLGAGLALACDMTIASSEASFGYPEVEHGLVAALTLVEVQRLVGFKKGLELLLTGRRVGPDEALQLGMINEIAPSEAAYGRTSEIAGRLASFESSALKATKQFYYQAANLTYDEGILAAIPVVAAARAARSAHIMRPAAESVRPPKP